MMSNEKIGCSPEAMKRMKELAKYPERFRTPADLTITGNKEMAERLATLDLTPPPASGNSNTDGDNDND